MPTVSVILPAYNAQSTIGETIQSIIDQTYKDWELIIINDGSTDDTKSVVLSFDDPRIKYIENDGNKKLIYTLNRGIELSSGKYIARMDSDDICMPTRFEKQVAFMEANPNVIVCGSSIEKFGDDIEPLRKDYFEQNEEIKAAYPILGCFCHPAVMMRARVIKENNIRYDGEFKDSEDYKLWLDLMNFGDYSNIPEVLLRYRISKTQCSQDNNMVQKRNASKCRFLYLANSLGTSVVDLLKREGITYRLIKDIKKRSSNRYILLLLYLSMNVGDKTVLLHYIFSFDWLKFNLTRSADVWNRFKGKSLPYLFVE